MIPKLYEKVTATKVDYIGNINKCTKCEVT